MMIFVNKKPPPKTDLDKEFEKLFERKLKAQLTNLKREIKIEIENAKKDIKNDMESYSTIQLRLLKEEIKSLKAELSNQVSKEAFYKLKPKTNRHQPTN